MSHSFEKDSHIRKTLALIQTILGTYEGINFAIQFWDGTTWHVNPEQPARFTLRLKHPGALRRMCLPPTELAICEAYFYDDFDIEGDFMDVFEAGEQIARIHWRVEDLIRLGKQVLSLPSNKRARSGGPRMTTGRRLFRSKERDRQAIACHYDISNEFYALWLDRQMVYSGAYYPSPETDLETAQDKKLDYICRKLRLRPGERLLDIGCGWGGLVMYATQRYGATAYGITLSAAQADLANARIRQLGLTDRCRVDVRDYQDIHDGEQYDKIASIEMLHHVRRVHLPQYFEQVWRLLRPGGVSFHLTITVRADKASQKGPDYARRYFMPDYHLVSLSTLLREAERADFEIYDVEDLRTHYELTAQQWLRRLEDNQAAICAITDQVTYRVWRLSLALLVHGFQKGLLNFYHLVLIKPDHGQTHVPLTRADWYDERERAG